MGGKMSFFGSIKSAFGGPALIRLAKSGNFSEFLKQLSKETIIVIAKDLGESASMQPQEEEFKKIVEAAAYNKTFNGAHRYEHGGVSYMPIFTSKKTAEGFCGAYTDLIQRLHAYRLFSISGKMLPSLLQEGDVLVIDPQDDREVSLTVQETDKVRVSAAGGDTDYVIGEMYVVLPMNM
jgi:hypothetical protein